MVASTYGGPLFHDSAWGFDRWGSDAHYAWRNYTEDLDYLVPHPKLRIWIGNPSTLEYPAASEFTLAYPAGKLEVTGAALGRRHPSGGLVDVTIQTTGSDCTSQGTARVSLIDPERQTRWIEVVYRVRDFVRCGRAAPGDFEIVGGTHKAYNPDGNAISPVAYLDPAYSF